MRHVVLETPLQVSDAIDDEERERAIKFANAQQRGFYRDSQSRYFGPPGIMRKQMRLDVSYPMPDPPRVVIIL